MENIENNWSKVDLEAYLLIYCANADFSESTEELNFINKKVGETIFKKAHKEFNKDNDYQSIQKIETALEKLAYTQEEKQQLVAEIKQLFLNNDTTGASEEILEANLLRGLKHIFK